MGSSGKKHKASEHLPKVGTNPRSDTRHEREAVEENMGLRPGGPATRIVGVVLVIAAVIAIVSLVALNT